MHIKPCISTTCLAAAIGSFGGFTISDQSVYFMDTIHPVSVEQLKEKNLYTGFGLRSENTC
jgi:hypothetical protein